MSPLFFLFVFLFPDDCCFCLGFVHFQVPVVEEFWGFGLDRVKCGEVLEDEVCVVCVDDQVVCTALKLPADILQRNFKEDDEQDGGEGVSLGDTKVGGEFCP